MGHVKEQQDAYHAVIDADSAGYDPNYLITRDAANDAPPPPDGGAQAMKAPKGYEAQPAPVK